jgi:prepilin-type N-terminal cleavage/methylation domain-containing protein
MSKIHYRSCCKCRNSRCTSDSSGKLWFVPRLPQKSKKPPGFGLIELLIALAILSTVAAIAVVAMSNPLSVSQEAVEFRNARQLCETHAAAKAAGAEFHSSTPEGLLEELDAGIRGQGPWEMTEFRLRIRPEHREAVLGHCRFDPVTKTLSVR